MPFAPSREVRFELEDAGFEPADAAFAADQLHGALQALFGTPERPGYLVLDTWGDEEGDRRRSAFDLDDDAHADLVRGNEVRFARQLAALRAGEPGELPRPYGAPEAWDRWLWAFSPLVEGRSALHDLHPESPAPADATDEDPLFTWGEEALRFWREHYPTLSESCALYQRHCLHCHGASGGGDGPSGRGHFPPPRDFRRGVFKWVAVEAGFRPRREDLLRVVTRGVEGTAMPAFGRLSRGELEGLVDWVRLLALRGETEGVAAALAGQRGSLSLELTGAAYEKAWERWDAAHERAAVVPGEVPHAGRFPASDVARGAELFAGEAAKCSTCHGEGGQGDGEAIFETDEAGRRVRRLDLWGVPSAPRDLTLGVFRGGARPADLFRRIRYGIGGTVMPAADPSLGDADVWALVAYVLALGDGPGAHGLARNGSDEDAGGEPGR